MEGSGHEVLRCRKSCNTRYDKTLHSHRAEQIKIGSNVAKLILRSDLHEIIIAASAGELWGGIDPLQNLVRRIEQLLQHERRKINFIDAVLQHGRDRPHAVSYTHLRAHETGRNL